MPKLRLFSGAELCDLLSTEGFERVRQRGSHVIMRRGRISFRFRFTANSIAAHCVELSVRADFLDRCLNKSCLSPGLAKNRLRPRRRRTRQQIRQGERARCQIIEEAEFRKML
jgi:hypothetical protein